MAFAIAHGERASPTSGGRARSSAFDPAQLQRDAGPEALHTPILSAAEYALGDRLPKYLEGPDGYRHGTIADGITADRLGPRVGGLRRLGATVGALWYGLVNQAPPSAQERQAVQTMQPNEGAVAYRARVAKFSWRTGANIRALVATQRSYFTNEWDAHGEALRRAPGFVDSLRTTAETGLPTLSALDARAIAEDPTLRVWMAAARLDALRLGWFRGSLDATMEDVPYWSRITRNDSKLALAFSCLTGQSADAWSAGTLAIIPTSDTAEAHYEVGRALRMGADLAYLGDTQGTTEEPLHLAMQRALQAQQAFTAARHRLAEEIAANVKTSGMGLRYLDGPGTMGPRDYIESMMDPMRRRLAAAERDTEAVVTYLNGLFPGIHG